jgi:hypothetical protein
MEVPKKFFGEVNNAFAYANHHIMYHREKNIVLYLTPKAGNSSLKKAILTGMGYDSNYEYPAGFEFITPFQAEWLLYFENANSIAFVRHPVYRFVSCWKNKFRDRKGDMSEWGSEFYKKMTLQKFFDACTKKNPHELNMHVRPMHMEIPWYNQYFKIEEWSKNDFLMRNYVGECLDCIIPEIPVMNQTDDVIDFDKGLLDNIADFYKQDMETFEYEW